MMTDLEADWSVVTGEHFRDRRLRLNLTQEELANEAGIRSRDTVGAVENGQGSAGSRRRIDDALTRLEHEAGTTTPDDEVIAQVLPNMIEFEVSGDFGVRVVVKGPVESAPELEATVARLIRDMKSESRD